MTLEPARRRAPEKDVRWRLFSIPVIPAVSSFLKVRVRDAHKLPASGAVIIAPNHFTNIDPVVVGYTVWKLGRAPRFLAKASLFRVPVVGAILRGLGQIPVERSGRGGANPLAAAGRLADDGLAVIIYPEGTLTRDPELWPMRGKTGAVRAALETGVPIVPVAHWGSQKLLAPYGKKLSLFPRKTVDLVIGDPVDLSPWEGRPLDAATLTAATAHLMQRITELVEQLRGESAPAERWDPAQHGQSEFGRP